MNDHTKLVAALREAADLLEQHPELPQPYITSSISGKTSLAWQLVIESIHGLDLAGQKATAREIIRTVGGQWAKQDGVDFYFEQERGLLDLVVVVKREAVCERVVVGTETRTIPAVEARPEHTETVEKVEWRCQPLLADEHAEAVA
jgi:hypothetical protein